MSQIIDNLILSSLGEFVNDRNMISKTSLHINAAQEVENKTHIHNIVRIDLNWYDSPLQDINANGILFHLVKLIDNYIICGKQVLVNCWAGVSRSTTIVLAYLMYKNKWNVQDALTFVRSKRPIVNPNYGFIVQLYNLQDKLHTLNDNFSKYCSSLKNKTYNELKEEITTTTSNIPFIEEIYKRELTGFDMPTNITSSFVSYPPTTNSSPYVYVFGKNE
jgi:protein-tyrosine phosphatase